MRSATAYRAVLLGTALAIFVSPASGQRPHDAKSPDEVLGIASAKKSPVLLLGVWHFNYPGLDDHKIDPSDQIDILSDDRQKEVGEILDSLAQFRPTKICLEWLSQETLNQSYRGFLEGKSKPSRSETYQIGFRLAQRLGHKEVYAVDAKAQTTGGDRFRPMHPLAPLDSAIAGTRKETVKMANKKAPPVKHDDPTMRGQRVAKVIREAKKD